MYHLFAWISLAALVTIGSANNTTDVPECVVNDDCASDRVCVNQTCVGPCAAVCGPHTVCHVTSHVAMCACAPGHTGNPALGCSPAPTVPELPGCMSHDQCPSSKACILGSCADPCEGLCGANTTCTVRQHIPSCACKQGHLGDPFVGCPLQVDPGTWPPFPHGKKRFYVGGSNRVEWIEAYMSCLRNNSRLVSVESMEEMYEIKKLIHLAAPRSYYGFWTSGSDYGDKGHFVWATTGKQLSPRSDIMWLPHHPANYPSGSCVCFVGPFWFRSEFGLVDIGCLSYLHYICEYYG